MDFAGDPFGPAADGGGNKKLIAGVRYGLKQKPGDSPAYCCDSCRKHEQRNCGNRIGYTDTLLAKHQWLEFPASIKPVVKLGDLKLYECPITAITATTWEILRIVNGTITADGDITCLPFPGAYLDQPPWYLQAVEIVRRERAEHRHREIKDK